MLGSKFELNFEEHSYGFRSEKNIHKAVSQALKYINDCYQDIVDIDLIPKRKLSGRRGRPFYTITAHLQLWPCDGFAGYGFIADVEPNTCGEGLNWLQISKLQEISLNIFIMKDKKKSGTK